MPYESNLPFWKRKITLRFRLTIWVVAIFASLQLLIGWGVWYYQSASTLALFEQQTLERSASVAETLGGALPEITLDDLAAVRSIELESLAFDQFDVNIYDSTGALVLGDQPDLARIEELVPDISENRTNRIVKPPAEIASRISCDAPSNPCLSVISFQDSAGNTYTLLVVTNSSFTDRQIALTMKTLLLGGLIGLFASCVSGWLISGIAVLPIEQLSSVAKGLEPDHLDEKLDLDDNSPEIAELSEDIETAREKLRQAFEAQARFLSNVSHELKTPIATILVEAQTLNRKSADKPILDFIESTEDEMRKLGRLVESFLTLTQIREGSRVAKPKHCPANELVLDAIEDCQPTAEQYDVHIMPTLAIDDDALDAQILGDPDLLRTMLNNIIRNAIRFSPKDARVGITATLANRQFIIKIDDQGPGITPELLENLFDRFVQADGEARRERGNGLGLAIAKGIAELHMGDIRAGNNASGGVHFTVTLPVLI